MELNKQALDNWLTTDPRDDEPEYDEDRPYVAHLETYDAEGNLTNIRTEDIGEWERLMTVGIDGRFNLSHITLRFADGSELTVSRDGGSWGDGSNDAEHAQIDPDERTVDHRGDVQFVSLCPVCLDPIDYCLGHGELG